MAVEVMQNIYSELTFGKQRSPFINHLLSTDFFFLQLAHCLSVIPEMSQEESCSFTFFRFLKRKQTLLMTAGIITWLDTESSKDTLGDLPDFGGHCNQHNIPDVPKGAFIPKDLKASAGKSMAKRIGTLPMYKHTHHHIRCLYTVLNEKLTEIKSNVHLLSELLSACLSASGMNAYLLT